MSVPLSPALRAYLLVSAAISGAAVLVVEILGAKLLAPFLGSSHFVWTAQITVTLSALAVGYWYGGWLVERKQSLARLYLCILGAAGYLGLTVVGSQRVALFALRFSLPAASLVAASLLFFVPLTLMATVVPFLVRVLSTDVAGVGALSGRLSAISTVGSVGGALLIGYVLIPRLPNSTTMSLTSLTLAALGGGYFLGWGRPGAGRRLGALMTLSAATIASVSWASVSPPLLFGTTRLAVTPSPYGPVEVLRYNRSGTRALVLDSLVHNAYDPSTGQSAAMFSHALMGLIEGYGAPHERALVIGLGVGIVPRVLADRGSEVDVVEINPVLVPVAERYFDFRPSRYRIAIGDGRAWLRSSSATYDTIVFDAFSGDGTPWHLITQEAFREMKVHLKPNGILVMNTLTSLEPGDDQVAASIAKTLRSVFKEVRIHHSDEGSTLFAAADQALILRELPEPRALHAWIRQNPQAVVKQARAAPADHGVLLTDDYNPVDYYDSQNREALRRRNGRKLRQQLSLAWLFERGGP